MKAFVVEDEEKISKVVEESLVAAGISVETCDDGNLASERLSFSTFDVILLDWMLPGKSGVELLREIREAEIHTPVLMLTARASIEDKVKGLDTGADDYLAKPFYVEELVARVKALLRRTAGLPETERKVHEVEIDLIKHEVKVKGIDLRLTTREFNLLEFMTRNPGTIHTRVQLLEHVWGLHFDPKTNLVDVYIKRIREKLEEADVKELIETIRGVGYRVRKD